MTFGMKFSGATTLVIGLFVGAALGNLLFLVGSDHIHVPRALDCWFARHSTRDSIATAYLDTDVVHHLPSRNANCDTHLCPVDTSLSDGSTHNGKSSTHSPTLVVYVLAFSHLQDPGRLRNIQFFLDHGVVSCDWIDFALVINGDENTTLPYVNICSDFKD